MKFLMDKVGGTAFRAQEGIKLHMYKGCGMPNQMKNFHHTKIAKGIRTRPVHLPIHNSLGLK